MYNVTALPNPVNDLLKLKLLFLQLLTNTQPRIATVAILLPPVHVASHGGP